MSNDTTKQRVVIKIGSSSLTSMHGEVSRRKLEKLVDEVVQLKDSGHEILLVSSGAVAAGYRKLGFLQRPEKLPEKQAAASVGQGLLMEAYSDLFLSHGYVVSQILITRNDFLDETRYNNVRNTINVLLERGIIPIVNENDTVTVDRLKFGDNDTLSAKVAGLVDSDKLMILSDIDGLYNANPTTNKDAKLVEKVHEITPEIEAAAGGSGSSVGTGGMKSKIDAVKIAMASGISTFLGKAGVNDILVNALNGTARGTYFEPDDDLVNLDQKKQWIAFNSGPAGDIILGENAKERIVEGTNDLLISNIDGVKGRFDKGAVVRILDPSGENIGLGVCNYSSEKLEQMLDENRSSTEQHIVNREDLVCQLEYSIPVGV